MSLTKFLSAFKLLPIHPQWLLNGNREAIRMLSDLSGLVLDIGCADRWVESALSPQCEYIGLDYLATGDGLYRCRPTVFADAACLPFPAESFNAVTLFEVLEHIAKPREAIMEAARVLKPDGMLLLTMPFMYPMHDEPYDFQRFTQHGLVREMKAAGLEIRSIKGDLSSIETAGLLMSLSLGGMAKVALDKRSAMILFIPALAVLITLNNCACWLMGRAFPNWPALTSNFQLIARKTAIRK